jgi:Spy/CpxP family protein refolding chaperone
MTTKSTLAALAMTLGLALPAGAQQPPQMTTPTEMGRATEDPAQRAPGPRGEFRGRPGGEGREQGGSHWGRRAGYAQGHRHHRRPLFGMVMRHRQELALTPSQIEGFYRLSTDYRREAIKRRADRQLVRVDLMTLMRPDPANPGKAVDMAQVEAKVREMEKSRADLQISRFRAIEQGKALLTPEQRTKLVTLMSQPRERQPRG